MKTLMLVSLSFFLIATGCNSGGTFADSPPNIVVILADDLGAYQLGCMGSEYYRTPNIDTLAARGIRFTQAYAAASVCSPTRAAILTGKYPARLRLTNFIPGNGSEGKLLSVPDWQKYLPLEEVTLAEALKAHGYRTAIFGKWHLSREKTPPLSLEHGPEKQGFDGSFTTYKPAQGMPLGYWQKPELDAHSVDTITARTIDFIRRNQNHPFFVMVSHNSIHDPLMERCRSIERYAEADGSDDPRNNPVIGAMIERLDASVGHIMLSLEESGQMDRTLIIFYSDNGGLERAASQAPLRHGKGWLYEGGIRVPLIIRWDGRIEPNTLTSLPVSSIDLFPTLTGVVTGKKTPGRVMPEGEDEGNKVVTDGEPDGLSLLPLLLEGDTIPYAGRALYWNFPHYHNGGPSAACRKGRYKIIEWYEGTLAGEGKRYELFDLVDDPGELTDLSDSLPTVMETMKAELESLRITTGAQVPGVK